MGEQLSRQHPGDANVRRRLAALYERLGQPEAVKVWQEAVALDASSPQGSLGLARTAIRFGNRGVAREALARLAAQDGFKEDLYRLRAGLALLEQDRAAREENLASLLQVVPNDDRVRLSLAAVQIRDPRAPQATAARATLIELAHKDALRIHAVVELLNDIARRWPAPARERSAAVENLADALTPSRGPLVEAPSQVNHVARLINYAMTQPEPGPEDVIMLANWMSLNGETRTALQWIDSLPAVVADDSLLKTAHAEFALKERDWPRLHRLLLANAWGAVPTEAVEQAFRAHAASARSSSGMLPGWSAALQACRGSPAGLRMLLRLARAWAWEAEARQVLLTIARANPRETWAWRELISVALRDNDSPELMQVYAEWKRAMPADPVVQVESAIMGFLLGWKNNSSVAETADFLRQRPENVGAAVSHALALWRSGQKTQAAAALDALPPAAWREPRYALAYGLILADVGRTAVSGEMLDRMPADQLLPEERDLVSHARDLNRGGRR